MFYILITIFLNVVVYTLFKVFPKYGIDTLQAIVANYIVCVTTGSIFLGYVPFNAAVSAQPWFPWALLLGVAFITVFNIIAYCTRVDGITTATIANKLSLVIPVVFSLILYKEHAGGMLIAGLLIAMPAVYLSVKAGSAGRGAPGLLWPALLFIGSGALDTMLRYVQFTFLSNASLQAEFTVHCFAVAGVIGLITVGALAIAGRVSLQWKNLVAGVCLGVPNYFSIYFLIRALNCNVLQSSAAIPVINIGILVASSAAAILFFKERAGYLRLLGLALSVLAIVLIAIGN